VFHKKQAEYGDIDYDVDDDHDHPPVHSFGGGGGVETRVLQTRPGELLGEWVDR
jgi:hypothetical protein